MPPTVTAVYPLGYSFGMRVDIDPRLPCGANWECSPITSHRWDRGPYTAAAQQAADVGVMAAAMRVGVAHAVRLTLRNESGSESGTGALPVAMAAAYRRQKAQREWLGTLWCRTAQALREPCDRRLSAQNERYCARVPNQVHSSKPVHKSFRPKSLRAPGPARGL